ncbi:sigma-54-dependent Fis family transcriptional regulator [Shewanella algicola]|uniref:Sigma-54-dependent Fis family transcriptional regulator n=1 Tax=Shewanella algicola TaxID=640633 RepID=A0A9X1Z3Z8_9GAMM|nr:sigma-54-dependent Fis family transcriptional regulator [Shewanella algicola]MCL1104820.1 sigma-54-dependent Fis family transcriptional regulator [Shewanella algicola]GGP57537.1 sigma-54-dependent Fis family transcriptional regulator [Shewanella algicola]
MRISQKQGNKDFAIMLNAYDCPAMLVTPQYQILATNKHYLESYGAIDQSQKAYCYKVSHANDVPCDQAGETCPLSLASASGKKERVLHIHHSPHGKEHIDIEILPILNDKGKVKFFIELLKSVTQANPKIGKNEMVGASPAFNQLVENITRVAPTEASVLLVGETGSGKEIAAAAVHLASNRKEHPMVILECSGLTETLFESELFGHIKGAFTGALYNKQGLVEVAHGGTLFLDEIGDVPYELQIKLLRLIETGTYRPVGGKETRRSDFRLICATHQDILAMVERGEFRRDLYYRINVFPIHIPSLNERKQDIPLLTKTILQRIDQSGQYSVTDCAISLLKKHDFMGNIRELRNILSRALVLSNTPIIDRHVIKTCLEIDRKISGDSGTTTDLKKNELNYLKHLIDSVDGDKDKAAALAGISTRSLYRKIQ